MPLSLPAHQIQHPLKEGADRLVLFTLYRAQPCVTRIILRPIRLELAPQIESVALHGVGSLVGLDEEILATLEGYRTRGRLSLPGLPLVRAAGIAQDPQRCDPGYGLPFITTEWIEGLTLDVISQRGPRETALKGILRILQDLHAQKTIYGDLKPQNTVIAEDEAGLISAHLIDLDTLREVTDLAHPITVTHRTREYAAPEQSALSPLCFAASDIFSLGIMICELVGGVRRGMAGFPPPLPPPWRQVAAACLRTQPLTRPQAHHILAFLEGQRADLPTWSGEPFAEGTEPVITVPVTEQATTAPPLASPAHPAPPIQECSTDGRCLSWEEHLFSPLAAELGLPTREPRLIQPEASQRLRRDPTTPRGMFGWYWDHWDNLTFQGSRGSLALSRGQPPRIPLSRLGSMRELTPDDGMGREGLTEPFQLPAYGPLIDAHFQQPEAARLRITLGTGTTGTTELWFVQAGVPMVEYRQFRVRPPQPTFAISMESFRRGIWFFALVEASQQRLLDYRCSRDGRLLSPQSQATYQQEWQLLEQHLFPPPPRQQRPLWPQRSTRWLKQIAARAPDPRLVHVYPQEAYRATLLSALGLPPPPNCADWLAGRALLQSARLEEAIAMVWPTFWDLLAAAGGRAAPLRDYLPFLSSPSIPAVFAWRQAEPDVLLPQARLLAAPRAHLTAAMQGLRRQAPQHIQATALLRDLEQRARKRVHVDDLIQQISTLLAALAADRLQPIDPTGPEPPDEARARDWRLQRQKLNRFRSTAWNLLNFCLTGAQDAPLPTEPTEQLLPVQLSAVEQLSRTVPPSAPPDPLESERLQRDGSWLLERLRDEPDPGLRARLAHALQHQILPHAGRWRAIRPQPGA